MTVLVMVGYLLRDIPFSIATIALAAVFLPSGARQRGTRLDIWGVAALACFLLGRDAPDYPARRWRRAQR